MAAGILTQLGALNEKLTIGQKLSLLTLGTVIFFGVFLFVYLLQNDQYQLLASDLDATNVSAITERLDQMGIPYQLTQGGRSVSVPIEKLNQARIEIASQGLPDRGRIGFEIFDESKWTMTEFTEKLNFRRALEGELEKTILELSEVSQARVHLVLEKEKLFRDDSQPAKASVVIKVRPGAALSSSRVFGITTLVASAVEGLNTDNVTVIGADGKTLSAPKSDSQAADVAQLDLRSTIEKELNQKAISLVEPLVGQGKVRASASVVLDNDEREQTEEIFDPERSAVLSQERTEDRTVDVKGSDGGIPGTASNEETTESPPVAEDRRVRTRELVNNLVTKTVTHTRTSSKGIINRISMSVVVDDAVETSLDENGETVTTTRPRSPEEIELLRSVVSDSIGFDAQRGDTLTVANISFQQVPVEPPVLTQETLLQQYGPLIQPAMRYLVILAVFLLFYLLIFRPVKQKVFNSLEFADPQLARLAAATGDTQMVQQLKTQMDSLREGGPASDGDEEVGLLGHRHSQIKKQLVEVARREPDTVTRILKSWLSQDF